MFILAWLRRPAVRGEVLLVACANTLILLAAALLTHKAIGFSLLLALLLGLATYRLGRFVTRSY